jgi:ATP synthase protein I
MVDFNNFKNRLKIAKKKLEKQSINENSNENGSSIGIAFKLGTELVSAVAAGAIIGFILDNWFDTKPWITIIFFFLGSIAGILNVIKAANRMQEKD